VTALPAIRADGVGDDGGGSTIVRVAVAVAVASRLVVIVPITHSRSRRRSDDDDAGFDRPSSMAVAVAESAGGRSRAPHTIDFKPTIRPVVEATRKSSRR
jgi:hypothetical protein